MWEVEGYKTEIVDLKQKFANVFQDKDLQVNIVLVVLFVCILRLLLLLLLLQLCC